MSMEGNHKKQVSVFTIVYWPFNAGQGTRYPKVICDLLENNFNLTIVTPYSSNHHKKTLSIERNSSSTVVRIPVIQIKKPSFIWRIINNISFSFACLLAWKQIEKNSLIFTVSPDPPYYVFIIPLLKRIKSSKHLAVLTDMLPDVAFDVGIVKSSFLKKIVTSICLRAYRSTDHITVITKSLKSRLVSYGISESKVSVVELAVDTSQFKPDLVDPLLLGLEAQRDKFIVMYSGSFGQMYDFDIFLESAKSIATITDNIHFIIRGDGQQKDYIASKIAKMNLTNVTQLGPTEETAKIISFINFASVCVVPIRDSRSIDMTHPSKILEFWACSKPVICTSTGEVAQLIARSNAGIATRPKDTQGMVDAILKLYNDRELLHEMGKNGRDFVTKEFSYPVVEKKLVKLISDMSE